MKQIGRSLRSLRVPALLQGEMTSLDFPPLGGRWSALCVPPTLGLIESVFLDLQTQVFEREGTTLFAVAPNEETLHETWCVQFGKLRIPLIADPLRRVRKACGLTADESNRCQSVLVDSDGMCRYRLIHDLNGRGMGALLEIVRASRGRPSHRQPHYPEHKRGRTMEPTMKVASQVALNICGCGRLHLLCDPVTLHFEPLEFTLFAQAIGQLMIEYQQHAAGMMAAVPSRHSPPTCH
jgi:hypothetical protein